MPDEKDTWISFRLPVAEIKRLERLAKVEDRSRSAVARVLLKEAMEARRAKQG